MNRKFLALTLAALPLTAGATGPQVFGKIGMGAIIKAYVTSSSDDGPVTLGVPDGLELSILDSTVGIRGKQQIAEGFDLVYRADVGLAGDEVKTKRTFLGVESPYGTVKVGRKIPPPLMEVAEIGDAGLSALLDNIFTSENTDAGLGFSVRFDSPKVNGLQASFQVTPGANTFGLKTNNDKTQVFAGLSYERDGVFIRSALGVKHNAGPEMQVVETFNNDNGEARGSGKSVWVNAYRSHTELGYTGFGATLTAGYRFSNNWDYDRRGTGDKLLSVQHEVGASLSYTLRGWMPHISWTHALKSEGYNLSKDQLNMITSSVSESNNSVQKQVSEKVPLPENLYHKVVVGVDYKINSNTTALVSAGWLHEPTTATNGAQNGGGSVSAIVGLRHSF